MGYNNLKLDLKCNILYFAVFMETFNAINLDEGFYVTFLNLKQGLEILK